MLTRDALIDLLVDHCQESMYGSLEAWCACNERLADSNEATHAAHLADVLEAAGYVDIREAQKARRYAALAEIEEMGSDDMPYTKLKRK